MKILVTGGAGFIGSAVIRHILNYTADSVVNVDKLTYAGNLESLAKIAAGIQSASARRGNAPRGREPCGPLHRWPGGVY